jgi:hypothetical protein
MSKGRNIAVYETGAKTFRKKTLRNADAVYLSRDKKHIVVHNSWTVPKKDKKGKLLYTNRHNKIRKYPNTKANFKKAESVVGYLRGQ